MRPRTTKIGITRHVHSILPTCTTVLFSKTRYRNDCFILLKNSLSDIFFFWSAHCSTSFPAKYLRLGFSLLTACDTTSATKDGGELLRSNCLKTVSIFFVILK